MASPVQITANRANAQLSTGPRTLEGKARVSQNALRHGLTARHLVIRPDEQEEFAALQDSLLADLAPQGAVETVTFHDLLHSAWSLHRLRRLEAQCPFSLDSDLSDPRIAAVLDRIGRYQSRAQRAYYRALHELRTLQTDRALRAVKLEEKAAAEVPAIAAINNLTKQTHSEVPAEPVKPAVRTVDPETGVLHLNSKANLGQTPAAA
ncbi:MAG: hypothetical protein LAQ69_18380 [Acidobacteriia bacterium]|nr:hypothetical protein [Terriglobia bacterium]